MKICLIANRLKHFNHFRGIFWLHSVQQVPQHQLGTWIVFTPNCRHRKRGHCLVVHVADHKRVFLFDPLGAQSCLRRTHVVRFLKLFVAQKFHIFVNKVQIQRTNQVICGPICYHFASTLLKCKSIQTALHHTKLLYRNK